jgi:hypothetical protein
MAAPNPTKTTSTRRTKAQAIKAVRRHVFPKPCFIWYKNNAEGFEPIPGTGCAHYVAHQLGIKGTRSVCADGFLFRVPDLVAGLAPVKAEDVQVHDIWANAKLDHTGLVIAVRTDAKNVKQFTIEHCSSRQGGVVTNDWRQYFHGQGSFYRPPDGRPKTLPQDNTSSRASRFPVTEAFS